MNLRQRQEVLAVILGAVATAMIELAGMNDDLPKIAKVKILLDWHRLSVLHNEHQLRSLAREYLP